MSPSSAPHDRPRKTGASRSDTVRTLLEPVVAGIGMVLEDVDVSAAGKRSVVRVVVDLPADRTGGMPVDDIAAAASAVSAAMDEREPLGESPYTLEVTSPGVDRPLTEPRHWARARGRLVRAPLTDGREVAGRVTAVDDAGVLIVAADAEQHVAWEQLGAGRVQIEFNRAPAAEEPADEPTDETDEPLDETDEQATDEERS